MSTSLLHRLRDATATRHGELERHAVMQRILSGRVTRHLYSLYLRNLHPIYAARKGGLACRGRGRAVIAFTGPPLFRSPAIARDLVSLVGPDWPAHALLPSAREYAANIDVLARERPALLGAHGYVRYLGDLSGGRVVRGRVAAALGLAASTADGGGLAFYEFAASPAALARQLRVDLEGLSLEEETADAIVAEAVSGFARHAELFDELEEMVDQSLPVN